MNLTDWSVALDMFEARLSAQRDALSMGPAAIEPWEPPALTTVLPGELADRAASLLALCRDLEDEIAHTMAATNASLDRLLDAPPAPVAAAEPVYFDSRV